MDACLALANFDLILSFGFPTKGIELHNNPFFALYVKLCRSMIPLIREKLYLNLFAITVYSNKSSYPFLTYFQPPNYFQIFALFFKRVTERTTALKLFGKLVIGNFS